MVPVGIVIGDAGTDDIVVYVTPSNELSKVNVVALAGIFVTNNVVEDVTLKVRDIYYYLCSSF